MIWGKPKVSILLTSYNNTMVQDTLDSIFNQTYKNWELIILDDNSKKEIQDIYKPYRKDTRVVYYNSHIKEKDRMKICPYARQINVGLKMATGKLIMYSCDDATFIPKKLETMVKYFRWHPKVRVCYNRQKRVETQGGVTKEMMLASDRILRDPYYRVDHNSVMHYKSCVDVVGDWDTESFIAADAYYWRKLGKKFPFYPIREVLEVHHVHANSFQHKLYKINHKT